MYADHPTTGRRFYFYDKALPFGASISCSLFQRFSNSLKHIVETITGKQYCCTNYLDDYLFIEATQVGCNQLVKQFLKMCQFINFPVALDKMEWAMTKLIFFGILIDGEHRVLAIPNEKRLKALHMIRELFEKRKATVKQLQVLAGTLNFLNKAIHPGRAFTRRMYAKYSFTDYKNRHFNSKSAESTQAKVLKQHHHVNLDMEFRFDRKMWELFLEQVENSLTLCRPITDLDDDFHGQVLNPYSDTSLASQKGFGAIFDDS